MSKKHLIFYLLVLIILSSNSFYQFKPFQENDSKMKFIFYLLILIALVLGYLFSSNKLEMIKNLIYKKQPIVFTLSLFVVTIISIYNAFFYKDQPLSIGLMTSLQTMSVYFLFFAIVGMSPSVVQFEKLIVLFGLTFPVILLIGHMTLPNPIFGSYAFDPERGGIRFRLPGFYWTVALYFYSIQRYREENGKKFLALIILCLATTVLTYTRQDLVFCLVLGFIFYLTGVSLKRKIIIVTVGLFFAFFVIPNTQIYKNYSTLTKEQLEKNKYEKEDVRVKDYRVFLFDYPRSPMQYLFGCGVGSHGNSKYGDELEKMAIEENLIQADTGWAGFVFFYGYVGAILLLIIIFKCLFYSCPQRYYYLKYIILYLCLSSVLAGSILYYSQYLILFFTIYILCRVSSTHKLKNLVTLVIQKAFITSYCKRCLEQKYNLSSKSLRKYI